MPDKYFPICATCDFCDLVHELCLFAGRTMDIDPSGSACGDYSAFDELFDERGDQA